MRGPSVYIDDATLLSHAPFVRRVLRFFRVPDQDIDDMLQEVMFAAWRSMLRRKFRPEPRLPLREATERWLLRIARNQSADYHRKAHRQRYELHENEAWSLVIDPDSTPEERASARGMLRTFRRLPKAYRDVVALTAVGATVEEIGAELGQSPRVVASRLRLARETFRKKLRQWRR